MNGPEERHFIELASLHLAALFHACGRSRLIIAAIPLPRSIANCSAALIGALPNRTS
jgi:hypothetical protein